MGSMFSGPDIPAVKPLPPLPSRDDPAIAQRKREEEMALRRRRGFGRNILTSGLGDTSPAPVSREGLLSKLVKQTLGG
jgi:hypothetical protein